MAILLAGDVGGTKTTLRLASASPAPAAEPAVLETLHEARFPSAEFPDLVPIVRRFLTAAAAELDREPPVGRPAAACFGIAGPIAGNACRLTNLSWSLSGSRLEQELDVPEVRLINDFAAIGYGVPELAATDFHTVQPGRPERAAPIAVIGAGTGLGEGFLIPEPDGSHRVFGGEGGHADFAPRSGIEVELQRYLRRSLDLTRVSVERVVSGRGIVSIYSFLRSREPSLESPAMAEVFAAHERGGEIDLAAEVSRAAMAKQDRLCEEAMRLFIEAYGAEAGNLALKLLPRGGLYVAGGIAGKILPLIRQGPGPFLASFLDKGRMRPELERIPVHVVLDGNVGLIGAARYASRLVAP